MSIHKTLSVYDYDRTNKICDLYDSNVELLGQSYDNEVTKEWNGTYTLSFKLPYVMTESAEEIDLEAARYGIAIYGRDRFGVSIRQMGNKNFRWMFMKSDYLIKYTYGEKNIWFVANKPKKVKSEKEIYGSVVCTGYETLLKTRNLYMEFDDENGIGTIGYLMTRILRGTGWTYNSSGSDVLLERDGVTEKVRSLKNDGKKGALDLIITTCNLFHARPIFDTDAMTVTIKSINNRTQILEGEVGRNITSLSVEPDSTDIVTRLYVEGEYGDYGYVGIDDVEVNGEPYGLPFVMNFDYYRELGTFKQEHETALATYLTNIKAKKAEIRANGTQMIELDDQINTMIGQCKLAVYYKSDGLTTPKYTYGDITAAEETLNVGDTVYILLDNGKYTKTTWSGSSQLLNAFGVAKFASPSAGKIGSAEVQIVSKEKTITQLQHKIDITTSADRIAEYTAEISALQAEITALYNDSTNGLYAMMYSVMKSNGLLYQFSQKVAMNTTLNNQQDDIEATFIAAMGYMLRDGYWNNKNYTVGQEEYLYADAIDMIEQMSKPKKSFSFKYVRIEDDFNIPAEDIEINAIFKIYDKELDINDAMFIKRVIYGIDNLSTGTIEVSNQDITLTSGDLGTLLSRISQLADLIEQKNALFERAKAISSDNTIFAERLNGRIDVLKTRLLSTVSNWYTDDQGNILFESSDGNYAMMLCGAGFMIASSKDSSGEWNWRTFGTGEGFTADEIVAGFISAERIEAGTIAVTKLVPNAGTDLNISANPALASIKNQIAPEFSTSVNYTAGQVVMYQGVVYEFTQDHPHGAWNPNHVVATTLASEINLVPGKISTYVTTALGAYSTTQQTADAISTYVGNALGNYSTTTQMNNAISSYVGTALGAYSTTQQTATAISTYVTNALGSYSTTKQTATAISTYVGTALGSYSTTTQMNNAISSYVTNALGSYSTTSQTATAISTYVTNALGSYSTTTQMNNAIQTKVATALNDYSTTSQTATAISTYVTSALGSYSTTTQMNNAITAAVGDKYGKVSGITITSSGIDVSGSQYVKIASGGYFQVQTGNFGIDTNSSTYVMWSGASSAANSSFWVKKDGSMKASNADITGTIHASSFYIGNQQASLALNTSGKMTLGSLESKSLSSYTFDSLGASSGTGVYITPSLIRVKSTGDVDFSAARSISLKASSISMAAISDYSPPDLSSYAKSADVYGVKSGITITTNGVDVSGSKHINLDVNANNYVHINSSGIDMKGSRVSVNGKDMWARDDIIVLKSTDNESTIISGMSGQHDWVLIKPYYNARIEYGYYSAYRASSNSSIVNMAQNATDAIVFGTATWYQYELSGTINKQSGEVSSDGASFTIKLSNSTAQSPVVSFNATKATTGSMTINFTFSSGHVSTNLCQDGQLMYMQLICNYTYSNITNLKLVCTCDSTTSRVPCTVYYFP